MELEKEDEICFIIGGHKVCFCFMNDKTISILKASFTEMKDYYELSDTYALINRNMIINTLYFVNVLNVKERLILMQTGNVLKVSRINWKKFK